MSRVIDLHGPKGNAFYLMAIAEENFIRGYRQALVDTETLPKE